MSLRNTSGSSLVEVMVMMVILSMSIVGIYSMVNSGKKLASVADTRLAALNIAREWLESVATLRDTFALGGYKAGSCLDGVATNAFFSTDGAILLDVPDFNCPQVFNADVPQPVPAPLTPIGDPYYILTDDKKVTIEGDDYEVCMNEFGWYSQEFSDKTNNIKCTDEADYCSDTTTQKCQTRFERKISFHACTPSDTKYCIIVKSTVSWWDGSLELSQILAPLD